MPSFTDPPYPDYLVEEYGFVDIAFLRTFECRQFVFWSAKADFPLDYTAIHIWRKIGTGTASMYERIFERNGDKSYRVFSDNAINNPVSARFAGDHYTGHPSQKPIRLMRELVSEVSGVVFDPFMGSGSTGVACASLDRHFVGIEKRPEYFDIACERIEDAQRQERLFA
jgi:DNA modification methylase